MFLELIHKLIAPKHSTGDETETWRFSSRARSRDKRRRSRRGVRRMVRFPVFFSFMRTMSLRWVGTDDNDTSQWIGW
jgi:hypothetical protein